MILVSIAGSKAFRIVRQAAPIPFCRPLCRQAYYKCFHAKLKAPRISAITIVGNKKTIKEKKLELEMLCSKPGGDAV
jgi:hypothetical protein